jgi:N-acetylmuramoyl-L-alanine amidase
MAFVSIHHNADPDGPSEQPGTEVWYQIDDTESRRLSGLVYEEVFAALEGYDIDWAADDDAGVKYRLNQRGTDYYGILRESAGVTASLAELAFLSNPAEEALLETDEVRRAEAGAVAQGVIRFLVTADAGSGFVEPYDRVEPAGSGGGASGCVDPPLA